MDYIHRKAEKTASRLAKSFPVLVITGPRQSGKTTLARHCFPELPYVSLENPTVREYALNDPIGFLNPYHSGAIFDEVQRVPALMSYLQEWADEPFSGCRFVLTGSQQFNLLATVSQSLAGRAAYLHLLPFSLSELPLQTDIDSTLRNGFYPPVIARGSSANDFYPAYVQSYLERDVRQVIGLRDLSLFQRFLHLCASRVGNLLNLSDLSRDCGISHTTASAWLSTLEAAYIVFRLKPHHVNLGKRVIKSPKLYFYDTGLAAYLLSIQTDSHCATHPLRGALFENLVVAEYLKSRFNQGQTSDGYFWRDGSGYEVDLLLEKGAALVPIEIKSGETVRQDWLDYLKRWFVMQKQKASTAYCIYGGTENQERSGVRVCSWRNLPFNSING